MKTKYTFLKRLLKIAPSVAAILMVTGLVGRAIASKHSIDAGYRKAARQAVADNHWDQAKFYYTRLVGSGDQGTSQDQLNWASILAASGDEVAAKSLLDQLAPDNSIGYGPAHLQKAKMLAAVQSQPPGLSTEQLRQLGWHLRHGARESNIESHLMWANYYLAIEQFDNAVYRFEAAAGQKPELWFDIANLYRKLGRNEDADRANKRAEAHAVISLEANPLDVAQRVRLLAILVERKKFDQVDKLLGEGLRINGDHPALREMASNLTLVRLGEIKDNDPDAEQNRMNLLSEAAQLSPSNPQVYRLLNAFYERSTSSEQKVKFREQLESWIASGQSVPMAHFSLGNLLWQESDAEGAIFHFEAALKIDPKLAVVANNLAWILCISDPPDYERAEKLIGMAIETAPENLSFRDTMGTVLFKQEKYEQALPMFEKVLPRAKGQKKKVLHENLAVIYDKLGQPSLAELHRKQAGNEQQ